MKLPKILRDESTVVPDMLPEGAIYFTTRKIREGWICEKVFNDGRQIVREFIGRAGHRAAAVRQFKIALSDYFAGQR